MKISFTNNVLILVGFTAMNLLQSCDSSLERVEDWEGQGPANVASNIEDIKAPIGFDFATTATASIQIISKDIETGEAMDQVGIQLFKQDINGELHLISKGATDLHGIWAPQVTLPNYTDSLLLQVIGGGYAQWHKIGIQAGSSTTYNLDEEISTSGRAMNDPIEVSTSSESQGGELGARSGLSYHGQYNRWGRPTNRADRITRRNKALNFIATALPQKGNVLEDNAHFLDPAYSNNVVFKSDGELWVSFLNETSGLKNAVGYFTYNPETPPKSYRDIDVRTIVIPNASFNGSGGRMRSGDRLYLGKFEKGTGVGWFLVPDGWDSGNRNVNDLRETLYSFDELNTFIKEGYRKQMLLLTNEEEKHFVLGIEDANRPNSDNDFNDVVLAIQAEPWTSVITETTPPLDPATADKDQDGVLDINDAFPADPERAYTSYTPGKGNFGTIAFEDMWPRTGDYDFNDLVVDYNVVEILDAKEQLKQLDFQLQVRAMGASQNHGFAFRLSIDPRAIESVQGQVLTDSYVRIESNGTESGLNEAIVPVFTDGFALFSSVERGGIVNTNPDLPAVSARLIELSITFTQAIDRERIGGAPYQPFMMRSQNRKREIHLAGNRPTDYADKDAFNTEADASDFEKGFFYIDKNNLPWAIHTPESFIYPKEQVPINKVYENFNDWATFGGETSRGWYQNTGANVNSTNGF